MQSYLPPLALSGALLSLACASPSYTVRPAPAVVVESPGARAVVVVRVPVPWYAPRSAVRRRFRDVLSEYEPLAPLEAKYFTISDDGRFGGIYLWKTRGDAEAHFDAAWREGVRRRRGSDADVVILDAPYVIEGRAVPVGTPRGTRSTEVPATASFVRWDLPDTADPAAMARLVATSPWPSEALVRGFVVTGPKTVGVAALWATREAAEQAVSTEGRAPIAGAIGAPCASVTLFEAPLLVDASIRGALPGPPR